MKLIYLNLEQKTSANYKKYAAIVDDKDYELISSYNWRVSIHKNSFYAVAKKFISKGVYEHIKMHRLILGLKKGDNIDVDHIDGNGLNNQRSNLRCCTTQQNTWNRRKVCGKSKYNGVKFIVFKSNGKIINGTWVAEIFINGKAKRIGSYINENDAANAYNRFAKEIRGDFANQNKIESSWNGLNCPFPPQRTK